MAFQIIRNDITKVRADVIVNTANPMPVVGGGTDASIYQAAGAHSLLAERKKIGSISPGQAAATRAFSLRAKYIIHTVGPVWEGGSRGEADILRSCYRQSLALAEKLKANSIAFPLIASGVYGFPKAEALRIALEEIRRFLQTHEMQITLVVFDPASFALSEQLTGQIQAYIDDARAERIARQEYGMLADIPDSAPAACAPIPCAEREHARRAAQNREEAWMERARREEDRLPPVQNAPSVAAPLQGTERLPRQEKDKSLEEMLVSPGDTFQQRLLKLIDERGLDDVTVYKNANIDRKVFSRIRCKADYQPKKKTAVAFAIALHLDMESTRDLLSRAGFALSPSSTFDLIISYFVSHGIYDMYQINAALFQYNQPILGT